MKIFLSGIVCAASLLLAPAVALGQPVVTFGSNTITVSGITPRGDAIFFGLVHEPQTYHTREVRYDRIVTDEDGDGIVTLTLRSSALTRAIWAVVDGETGLFTLAGPPGFPPHVVTFPLEDLRRNGPEEIRSFLTKRELLDVLLVRPRRGGVWRLTTGDGGPRDRDGVDNGRVDLWFDDLRAVHRPPTPARHVLPGDTIIAIDPIQLQVFATRIAR